MAKSEAKITIDATDAIKTLKAIQREARKATKALRTLEEMSRNQEKYETNWKLRRETEKIIETINNAFKEIDKQVKNRGNVYVNTWIEEKQTATTFSDEEEVK